MNVEPNPKCVPHPLLPPGAELGSSATSDPDGAGKTAWGHLQRELCNCSTHEKSPKCAAPGAWGYRQDENQHRAKADYPPKACKGAV